MDFISAFNTIIPALLQDKLSQLHVSDSTCICITDFLSDRKQHVKLGKHVSDCILSPLLTWCGQNNLELNALKTVEMVVDFRRSAAPPASITLCDSPVDTVESFRFLGTIISQDLKWKQNISSLIKKAQDKGYISCGS